MHGAETGVGVWDAVPQMRATRSVRKRRAEEGVVPESVSSEKPRALVRDVLPQTGIVAVTTSVRGGAVSHPIASIRKTCPATGFDPSLAGLLTILLPPWFGEVRIRRGSVGLSSVNRTVLPLVCTKVGESGVVNSEWKPAALQS